MRELIGLLAFNLCLLGAGYGVLAVLPGSPRVADVGLAFCAGFALLLVAASALATAGVVVGSFAFALLAAAATAPAAWAAWSARARVRMPRLPTLTREHGVVALILTPAALYAATLFAVARVDLLDEWDAWSMWTMKAKALVVFGDLGVANGIGAAHPDYPILIPMMQSLLFRFMGSFDTQLVHVEYVVLLLAFAGAAWRLVSGVLRPVAAAGWLLYVLMIPGLERNVPDALADVPVALFAALVVLTSALWLGRRDPQLLVFAGLFAAAALWIKNEGAAAIAVTGAACILLGVRRPLRQSLLPPVAAFGAAGVSFLPWVAWRRANGIGGDTDLSQGLDISFLADRHDRSVDTAVYFWDQLADVGRWLGAPYILVGLAVVALLARRPARVVGFALLVPVGLLGFYVWVYTVHDDPLGLQWLLETSSSRVITTVALIGATMILALLASIADRPPVAGCDDAAAGSRRRETGRN